MSEDRRLGTGICKTGDSPQRFIDVTRARLIARYRMHSIPGRPEELESNDWPQKIVSFAYSGGQMRIRKHGVQDNRNWDEVRDFQLRDGWLADVYEYLDDFFGYINPRTIRAPRNMPV
jgi:hypothetical protein